jgi:Na+/H+-dicarboxylate symporter
MNSNSLNIRRFLEDLSRPSYFVLGVAPFAVLLGFLLPQASSLFQHLGGAGLGVISLPAIPVVISSVTLGAEQLARSARRHSQFNRRLWIALITTCIGATLIALVCAIAQQPGVLTPEAQVMVGTFIEEKSDPIYVNLNQISTGTGGKNLVDIILDLIPPSNFFFHTTNAEMIKVILVSAIAGLAMSTIEPNKTDALRNLLESVNFISKKVLDYILLISPLVIIFFIASSVSTFNLGLLSSTLTFGVAYVSACMVCLGAAVVIYRWNTKSAEPSKPASPGEDKSENRNPVLQAFTSALTTANSLATYSLITRHLSSRNFNPDQADTSTSINLLIGRTGPIAYVTVAAIFALNFFDLPLSLDVILKVMTISILFGIATAGLHGVAAIAVMVQGIGDIGIPTQPLLLMLIALDPLLMFFRSAVSSATAMAASAYACNNGGVGDLPSSEATT